MGYQESELHQRLNTCSGTSWQIYNEFGDAELPSAEAVAAAGRLRPRKRSPREAPKTFAEYVADIIPKLQQRNIIGTQQPKLPATAKEQSLCSNYDGKGHPPLPLPSKQAGSGPACV